MEMEMESTSFVVPLMQIALLGYSRLFATLTLV